jgi:hypothetical protein
MEFRAIDRQKSRKSATSVEGRFAGGGMNRRKMIFSRLAESTFAFKS